MARPQPLQPAPRAQARTYSVRVFQAARENKRTLARLLQASTGNSEIPKELRPKEIKRFHFIAQSMAVAKKTARTKVEALGHKVRAVNRGHRDFVVYVAHPEDVKNVPTDS